jgi:hypothetical protein
MLGSSLTSFFTNKQITNATTTPLNIILRNVIQKAKPQRLSPKAQLPNQRWEARKEALLSF